MIRNRGEITVFFHTGIWLPAIRQVLCCLLLALPMLPAYAKLTDSLPLPAAEQDKPAEAIKPAMPPQQRGQLLYENHCLSCHASVVHIRERPSARSLEDIREWTRRWAGELRLPWGAGEIDEVTRFLNSRHYKFEEPPYPSE